MIRPATAADISAIVSLGREMHGESPNYEDQQYSSERAEATAAAYVASGGFFVAENQHGALIGMGGATVVPHYATEEATGRDLLFYVSSRSRVPMTAVRLIRAMEGWALDHGAMSFVMTPVNGKGHDRTIGLLEALDYTPIGTILRKRLHRD